MIVDIILTSIPFCILIVFLFNSRLAFIIFLLIKFTTDMLWNHNLFGYNINILQLNGLCLIIMCFVELFKTQKNHFNNITVKILVFIIILNFLVSIWGYFHNHFDFSPLVASPLTLYHIFDWNLRFLSLALVFIIFSNIFNKTDDLQLISKIFLFSTIIPIIFASIDYFNLRNEYLFNFNTSHSIRMFPRIMGKYHDSSSLAIVLLVASSTSFFLYTHSKKHRLTFFYLLYFIISVFLLYNTYTRSIWLTFVVTLLLFYFFQKKYIHLIVSILLIIIFVFFNSSVQKRFEREFNYIISVNQQSIKYETLGTGRIGLWLKAAQHFTALDVISQIIGTGGSYGSHNQYINWLLKNGILGFIFHLLFLTTVSISLFHRFNNKLIHLNLALFLSVIFISNLFMQIWDNITFNIYFWGTTSIIFGFFNLKRIQPMQL